MKTNLIRKLFVVVGITCLLAAGCNGQPLNQKDENMPGVSAEGDAAAHQSQATPVVTDALEAENLSQVQEPAGEAAAIYQPPLAVDSGIELDIVPLDMRSSSAEINERIAQSQSLWRTVWLEGLATWYPPEGEQAAPQVYRGQLWFDQAGVRFRSLIGLPGADPSSAKVSDGQGILEFDPLTGNSTNSSLPDFAKEGLNLAGIVGSPLSELLFSGSLAQRGGTYIAAFTEKIAGRPALVVDWFPADNEQPVDRFWVDTQTGVFLRMQHFGKAGGDEMLSDIRLTQIFYNLELGDSLFRLPLSELPVFQEDWSKVSEIPHRSDSAAPSAADTQFGEIYFNWFSQADGSPRLMRLSAACLVNNTPCPEAEMVKNAPHSSVSSELIPISLVWSPDGSRAAAALKADGAQGPVTELFLYQPESESWTVLGTFDPIDTVVWSRDGQWIAFLTNLDGYKIYAIRADDVDAQVLVAGNPITVEDNSTEVLQIIGWNDGSLYYTKTIHPSGNGTEIYKISPDGGPAELVQRFLPSEVGVGAVMTPGGQVLTVASDDLFRYLNLVDLNGQNLRRLVSFKKSHGLFSSSPDGQWILFTMSSDPAGMDFSQDVFAVRPDGKDVRQLASFDNYLEGMIFSLDSRYLLVHGRQTTGQLFLISLEDGGQRLLQIPGVPLDDWIGQVTWRPVSQ